MLAGGSYLGVAARFGVANSTMFAAPPPPPFVFGCSLGLIKGGRCLASYDRWLLMTVSRHAQLPPCYPIVWVALKDCSLIKCRAWFEFYIKNYNGLAPSPPSLPLPLFSFGACTCRVKLFLLMSSPEGAAHS